MIQVPVSPSLRRLGRTVIARQTNESPRPEPAPPEHMLLLQVIVGALFDDLQNRERISGRVVRFLRLVIIQQRRASYEDESLASFCRRDHGANSFIGLLDLRLFVLHANRDRRFAVMVLFREGLQDRQVAV